MKNSRITGSVSVILSAVLFGLMPLITRIAYANGCNPFTAAFLRFLFGSGMLFLLIRFVLRGSVRVSRGELLHLLGLSVFYAVFLMMLYASYLYIGSGLATTLHFTYPIFVIAITALFLRAPVSRVHILCLALCAAGMLLIYTPDGRVNLTGIFLAAGSGLVYSVYIVLVRLSRVKEMPAVLLSFWLSVFAAAEIGIFILVTGNVSLPANAAGWGASALLALTANVFGLVLFQKGLELVGGVQASLLSTFEPLTGVVVGVCVLGELLTARSVAAIVCILLSSVLLIRE